MCSIAVSQWPFNMQAWAKIFTADSYIWCTKPKTKHADASSDCSPLAHMSLLAPSEIPISKTLTPQRRPAHLWPEKLEASLACPRQLMAFFLAQIYSASQGLGVLGCGFKARQGVIGFRA